MRQTINAIHVNPASWHFKLARLLTEKPVPMFTDICDYRSAVILGLMRLLLATIVTGIAVAILGDWLAWLAACIHTWSFLLPNPPTAIALAFTLVLAVLAILATIHWYFTEADSTDFVRHAWRSAKDKFCTRVVIDYPNEKNMYDY